MEFPEFDSIVNDASKAAGQVADKSTQQVRDAAAKIDSAVADTQTKIDNAVKDRISNLEEMAKNAAQGAEKTINGAIGNPAEAITSLGTWDLSSELKPKIPEILEKPFSDLPNRPLSAAIFGKAENDDNFPFYGYVKVGGQKYAVVECKYEFFQTQDSTGKPSSRPRGGNITFKTPSLSDDNVFFYKWMFSKTEVESGFFKFVVYSSNNKRNYKTVSFENAYCVKLQDYFNDKDSKLMYTEVTIAAEIIQVGSNDIAEFNNEWS